MALARWNGVVQDAEGNAVSGAQIEVRNEATGGLAPLYADRDGAVGLGNPYVAPGAEIAFHARGGNYRITASKGSELKTWRWVAVGTSQAVDVEDLMVGLQAGIITAQTLEELNANAPETPDPGITPAPRGGVVWNDPSPALNGYYTYNYTETAWEYARPLPDTFAKVLLSGTGTAQTGVLAVGVSPAGIEVFFAKVAVPNTGALTLSINGGAARQVVNLAGNPLSAGEWTGMVMFYLNEGGQYQLLIDAGAAQVAAASASFADERADDAEAAAIRAENAASSFSEIGTNFKTVSNLLADVTLGYTGSAADVEVDVGDIVTAQGFRYEVAASGATDNHLETAGGVKLYVRNRATVLAWGVAGDGVADDAPIIQKALDALLPGECFSLAGGTFACSGVSVGVDNVHVENGKLIAHPSIAANAVIKAAPGTTGVQFHNIKTYIDRTAIAATDCAGILFDQCSDGKAINCEADGSRNDNYGGLNILGTICAISATNIKIVGCRSDNAHREGIMARMSDDVYIEDCEGWNAGFSNIGTSGGSRAHILGCRSFTSGTTGITMNSKDSVVANNISDGTVNAGTHGILIGHLEEAEQYAENCLIANNRVVSSGGRGISIVYGINCVVTGNSITDFVNYGIYVIPHPDDPGGVVVSGNSIDGGSNGVYVYGASDCAVNVSDNTIQNCSGASILVACNGEVAVSGNIIRDAGGGIHALGHVTGSTFTGDGIKNLVVSGNIFNNIEFNGVVMQHLRQAIIADNVFDGINWSANANADVIRLLNTNGGTASSMPTSVAIKGNTTKNTNAVSELLFAQTNIKGDGTITLVAMNDNDLQDFTAARLCVGPGASIRIVADGNQIGTDPRYTTFTIASGTTSTVVNNSNIASTYGQTPSMFSTGSEYYTLGARISAFGNGTFTLTHTAPVAPVTVILKVA